MNVLPRKTMDVPTPAGTGYTSNVSPAQKQVVKAIWKFIIATTETGEAVIPVKMIYELLNFALTEPGAQNASSKAAIKGGWFSKKAHKAIKLAQSEGYGVGMVKLRLINLGFNVEEIRASLRNGAGDDNPGEKWNIINSCNMLLKALKWRVDEDVLDLNSKSDKELDGMFHGNDKEDQPLIYINVRKHHPGDQSSRAIEKLIVYILETAKIRFTKKDQDLLQYIPAEHLPDKFNGGLSHYKYKYVTEKPDENVRMKDTETKNKLVEEWEGLMRRFEALSKEWATAGTEQANSTRNEEQVDEERIKGCREIRTAYFTKDPYFSKDNEDVEWTYNN
ncbi:hypothetical protein BGZ70_003156 [Mortierella alpina]|uniref:CRAL-TRIO domain-containing protein n=1 Tax=Mortierella alpina TaxID=64518 RepID=A0A9P6ISU5_MORAP|nr:hypothetical protein BGZ70_003156 [Mortierella alpina]